MIISVYYCALNINYSETNASNYYYIYTCEDIIIVTLHCMHAIPVPVQDYHAWLEIKKSLFMVDFMQICTVRHRLYM